MEVVGCLGHLCSPHPPPPSRRPLQCGLSCGLTWHSEALQQRQPELIWKMMQLGAVGCWAGGRGRVGESSRKASQRVGSEAEQKAPSDLFPPRPPAPAPLTCRQSAIQLVNHTPKQMEGLPESGGGPAVGEVKAHIPWGWLAGGLWGGCPQPKP